MDFAMHLGDVIDGKNRPEEREQAMSEITGAFDELGQPHYHVIGNHWCATPPGSQHICCRRTKDD